MTTNNDADQNDQNDAPFFDPTTIPLGKQPASIDPRTLRLADFIDWSALPAYPAAFRDSDKVANWQMLGNDAKGNCVLVGDAHQEELFSTLAGTPWKADTQACIDTYLQLTGGQDVGLNILNYLRWRRKNPGASSRKMLGFAAVNWRDPAELAVATSMFHGVLRGILLPKTAQSQSSPGSTWSSVSKSGDGAPGSWGGHLTLETDYDDQNVAEITWGYVQRASRQFMIDYCDEAYCVIPNYTVPGFDYNKFLAALKEIDPSADADPPEPTPVPPPNPTPPGFDITKVSDVDFNAEYLRRYGDWANIDIAITHRKGAVWKRGWQG